MNRPIPEEFQAVHIVGLLHNGDTAGETLARGGDTMGEIAVPLASGVLVSMATESDLETEMFVREVVRDFNKRKNNQITEELGQ